MASQIGITSSLGGITTPHEHWQLILSASTRGELPLPPKLFTVSRDRALSALEDVFTGRSKRLFLLAESEDDVEDFVSAYLASLEKTEAYRFAHRCLFVS